MDKWQYLLLLGGCLLITLPLEFLGGGVYRQPRRLARSLAPVLVVFLVWDAIAIVADVWHYNPQYISGINVPFMPLEEFLFFIVIPICGLLTYTTVSAGLVWLRQLRDKTAERSRR
ncbi:lycopene cyclase domain-containing protein [Mycolicibacterium sp.]|uniref:lycopene cyclase domain-containing protein n=1 Tax=Mycolicibacterium sp. TaxID=2320850 RepID=UPI001D99D0AB|nr:lycopene cyclase domain-containing protein [Mycolicibacterium sp.]MCB1290237.1 lycopene cyclase domain-containing protein [Mycobacterium sp.]MCB9411012.1 lycopene cyclase domain-containing protein [Mycolicibacterium sp.]